MFSELSFSTPSLPQSRGILDSDQVPKSAQPTTFAQLPTLTQPLGETHPTGWYQIYINLGGQNAGIGLGLTC